MPELTIIHYVESNIPVIKLDGKMTIGEASAAFRNSIREHLAQGKKS